MGVEVDMDKCTIYGKWEDPSTWTILQKDQRLNGAAIVANKGFVREYADYEECRKWVLTEIRERRKIMGKSMNDWLQRKTSVVG